MTAQAIIAPASINGVSLAYVTATVTVTLTAYVEANHCPDPDDPMDEPTARLRGQIKDALKYHAGWGVSTEPGDVLAQVDDAEVSVESVTGQSDPRDPDEVRDLIQGRAQELS